MHFHSMLALKYASGSSMVFSSSGGESGKGAMVLWGQDVGILNTHICGILATNKLVSGAYM